MVIDDAQGPDRRRPVPEVPRIGPGVPYLDGSEAHLLEVMRGVADLSSGSDELDRAIVDWPTRYHLSHQRSNLLRPLRVRPGLRVLDVGAGTGSLARFLGERGAQVTALEGNMARAEVAAVRCSDLDSVEVLCGTIDDLEPSQQFDLITVIGVLEYSAATIGGAAGPAHLLDAVRSRLSPGGTMVLAIENQLGLKYLLGGAEDHHGEPWVGLEGYPGPPGPRTWSRRELGQMLAAAGLGAQRWLFPYPDYKLPAVVLDEQVFREPDAEDLVDQLVLRPVSFVDAPAVRLADASAAQQVLVRAGLGPDVASSFLVLAAPDQVALEGVVDPGVLAWIDGSHRRPGWRRHRLLTTARHLVVAEAGGGIREGWLSQEIGDERAFEPGRTLSQQLNERLRAHDRAGVAEVLGHWWAELQRRADVASPDVLDAASAHPFLLPTTSRVLPDGHLDVSPSNFVDRDGTLILVDDEWRVGGPVDLELVTIRALWVLAQEIVTSGISHPWDDLAPVSQVFGELCEILGLHPSPEQVDAFQTAEVALQQLVAGGTEAHVRAGWLNGALRGVDVRPDRQLELERDALRAELAAEQAERRRLADEREELAGQLAHYDGLLFERDAAIAHLRSGRGAVKTLLRRVRRSRG